MSRHGYRSQERERLDTTVQFEVPRTRTGPIDGARAEPEPTRRSPRGGQPSRARSWWPPLSDELFQVMYDDGNAPGRLRIAERTAALGLAGALLAELAYTERIGLYGDTVTVVDLAVPSDVAAHMILAEIAGEPQDHPVSTWVHYLADTAYERVARRMVQGGRVREQVRRHWLRSTTTFVPVSLNEAAWPAARLMTGYAKGRLHSLDCVLTGLVCAVGLQHHVFFDLTEHDIAAVPNVLQAAPVPLPALVRLVHATVGQAVMTAR